MRDIPYLCIRWGPHIVPLLKGIEQYWQDLHWGSIQVYLDHGNTFSNISYEGIRCRALPYVDSYLTVHWGAASLRPLSSGGGTRPGTSPGGAASLRPLSSAGRDETRHLTLGVLLH